MTERLNIIAGFKDQKTFLKESYCREPFKIANVTEDKSGDTLHLMIRSSSPGILNNDHYLIKIDVEENANLHLSTQGYQRLYTMTNKASQHMEVHLHHNGSLSYLPHPGVPHKDSNYSAVNNIYLSEKHHLIWSEIITCGRKLSGEEFQFTSYRNLTNIYLNKKLVARENVLLEPLKKNIQGIGQMEGHTHQSTLLFINDHADMKKMAVVCNRLLSEVEEISFGITLLPVNGLLFRILGNKGEKLFDCNNALAGRLQSLATGKLYHS